MRASWPALGCRSRVPPWLRVCRDGSASYIVRGKWWSWRRRARVRPAGPAPMMAIFGWGDIVVVRVKRRGEGCLIFRVIGV